MVWHHLTFWDHAYADPSLLGGFATDLLSSGWLGVNLFFFLSGLVLYLPYAEGRRQQRGLPDARDFYRRRARRLLPLYFFIALVSLVFVSGYQPGEPRFFSALALYLTVLFPFSAETFLPPGNAPLWSLGVEIWLSLLFPLLVVSIVRLRWRGTFAWVIALAFATRLYGQIYTPARPGAAILNFVSDSVLGRCDDFLWGMWMAQWIADGRLVRFDRFALPLGLTLVILTTRLWGAWFRAELPIWTAAGFNPLLDLGMFLTVGALARHVAVLSHALESWPVQMFGLMCYSVFVWHGPLLSHFRPEFEQGGAPVIWMYLGVTLGFAAISYRYIEFGHVRDARTLLPARG